LACDAAGFARPQDAVDKPKAMASATIKILTPKFPSNSSSAQVCATATQAAPERFSAQLKFLSSPFREESGRNWRFN